ncbi:hypothetical protein IM774_07060 [Erysipelotrichaceae bacterium RD49]|nr:hypothetical protein [Erysipelotrichaceae bacterium RD49]
MKLAKKFVSLAAALAMGTCVYTVPVFANSEDPLSGTEEVVQNIENYVYSSSYDQSSNQFKFIVQIPEGVRNGNEDLFLIVGTASANPLLKDVQSIEIGSQTINGEALKNYIKDDTTEIPGLANFQLPENLKTYRIQIPYSMFASLDSENSAVSVVFNTNKIVADSLICAYSATQTTLGNSLYTTTVPKEVVKATEYVTYKENPFVYDEETDLLTTQLTIDKELPGNLTYDISWLSGERMPSLTIKKVTFNGNDIGYTKSDLSSVEASSIDETAQVEESDEAEFPSFENEAGESRKGFRILISKDVLKPTNGNNNLILTFDVDGIETDKPVTRLLDLQSKVYIDGHNTENEAVIRNQIVNLGDLETYKYSSAYDQATNRFTLNVQVPEKVFAGDEDLYMMIGAAPDGSLLESLQSIKIGNQAISEGVFKTFVKDTITIPGLKDITLPDGLKMYRIQIPYSQLNNNMSTTNDEITFVFNTKKDAANSMVYAYASTNSLKGKELYTATVKDEAAYNITGVYNKDLNTWTVGVQPSGPSIADGEAYTTIDITSTPNVMTKLNTLVIGTTEVLKDQTGETASADQNSEATSDSTQVSDSATDSSSSNETASNETGEGAAATLKKINNGYQIQVKNKDLQGLSNSDWIKATFATEANFDTSKMTVTAESGNYKSDTYEKDIKAEVGDTTNVTFKGSHDYDSTKQTWTVNLAMTGRPDKLDLTFTQTEGTALGKPTSITVDGTAVSPTVNTQMSGSTMSVCTVDFRKEDLDKIKADSKVTLVFPIDGSTEQSERILMNVDLGNSSKDLSAKFTVKKSSTSPSSSSNVHTATESGMSTMLVVAAVALAAFAVFGVLAFKKKKSK